MATVFAIKNNNLEEFIEIEHVKKNNIRSIILVNEKMATIVLLLIT
jgi:hypothetical protein